MKTKTKKRDSYQGSMRHEVLDYARRKYGVSPDCPWKKYSDYAVLRHSDNNKWFALVAAVSRDRLGVSGAGEIDVVNLKVDDPYFRDVLLRDDGIVPAYHMNKTNWVTVFLDGSVSSDRVYDLIDASFMATASAKKKERFRPAKEWVIPANPKYYDIKSCIFSPLSHAFDNADEIDWKQGSGIKTGDTVFMYVTAPISAIMFKCKVGETDIPYKYSDGNIKIKSLMRIKLMKRYGCDRFTFDVLREEYGIHAIRGPRGIPNSLSAALKE